MPDPTTDGNQTPAGSSQPPVESAPQGQGQPLDVVVKSLQSQVETLTKKFEQGIQKENAKANSRLEKQISGISSQIGRILELQGKGMSEPEIKRELFLDNLMQGNETPSEPTPGTSTQGQAVDVEAVVQSLQFQPNDPALAALKIKYSADPQGLVKAAADLRLQQLQTPNPTPATTLSQQGSPATTGTETQALINRLGELQKLPSRNRAEIAQIKQQLEARGWQ